MKEILSGRPDHADPPEEIKGILGECRKIAVVGLSPKESRDSNRVARYLMEQGYEVVPVNPGQKEILGKTCYRSLSDIPFQIDMANLFLNPTRILPVVYQAIEIGVSTVWMQLGVVHNEGALKAKASGIQVVMDRCTMRDHKRLSQDGYFSQSLRQA